MARHGAQSKSQVRGDNLSGTSQAASIAAQGAGTVNGTAFNTENANAVVGTLNLTAKTGTVTLDVKLQTSEDGSTWTDVGSFAQLTAVGATGPKVFAGLMSLCRWVFVVAGTTPVVTANVSGFTK